MRRKQDDAADCVQRTGVLRPAFIGEREYVRFIGRHKHLIRRALRNLLSEIARRSVYGFHNAAGFGRIGGDNFVQRKLEIGRSRNLRSRGGRASYCRENREYAGNGANQEHDECAALGNA